MDMSKTVVDVPEWFRGCSFNYAENLLCHSCGHGDKTALITAGQAPCLALTTHCVCM